MCGSWKCCDNNPYCSISQLNVGQLKWHAHLPTALATDDNSSEPGFDLLSDECTAFGVSVWSTENEDITLHTERRMTQGGTEVEWADLKRGSSPPKDVMP